MNKHLLSLLLILSLCLGMLTGCGSKTEDATQETEAPQSTVTIDPNAAYAKFQPSDVVLSVNGSDVTWSEFFYALYSIVFQMQYASGNGQVDWDAPSSADADLTNGQYAWQSAVDTCQQYHVVDTKAAEMSVTLTDEDREMIAQQEASDRSSLCGEDAAEEDFLEALSSVFLTRDSYDFLNRVYFLYNRIYTAVCGTDGDKLTQEDIDECIRDNQYVTVKHILISTLDPEGNPMEGQDLAEKTALATLILTQLQEVQSDTAALAAKFDELMHKYSEDTGLPYYPDGYTFRPGEMVQEFEDAANATEVNALYPDLVQSNYGYHIILRLPTTRDSVVTYVDPTTSYTIGTYAAASAFNRIMNVWMDEAEVTWSPDFEKLTVEEVFG